MYGEVSSFDSDYITVLTIGYHRQLDLRSNYSYCIRQYRPGPLYSRVYIRRQGFSDSSPQQGIQKGHLTDLSASCCRRLTSRCPHLYQVTLA